MIKFRFKVRVRVGVRVRVRVGVEVRVRVRLRIRVRVRVRVRREIVMCLIHQSNSVMLFVTSRRYRQTNSDGRLNRLTGSRGQFRGYMLIRKGVTSTVQIA